jgi:Uma2 family endonuclease
MSQSTSADLFSPEQAEWAEWVEEPDISHLVTEDDTPVDNLLAEKQQRLLTSCLYSSWKPGVPFLATANVGLFYTVNKPAIVPDVLLSLDVEVPQDWQQKKNRSYFTWIIGKPPEVVIEIVSNTVGNELGSKMKDYARIGVAYYVVYDPFQQLGDRPLRVHELRGTSYTELETTWMEPVGLGLTLWDGISLVRSRW